MTSKQFVKDAAYVFVMEGLSSTDSGMYDSFFDFLQVETDQRWVLPHYFFCLFDDGREEDAGFKLGLFLWTILNDKDLGYLLEQYLDDVHEKIKDFDQVEDIFVAFETIRQAKKDGAKGKTLEKLIDDATEGVHALRDWHAM